VGVFQWQFLSLVATGTNYNYSNSVNGGVGWNANANKKKHLKNHLVPSGSDFDSDRDCDNGDNNGKDRAQTHRPVQGVLHNRFFGMRHGQSRANVEGVIASDPTTATVRYGLSDEGLAQARRAGKQLVRDFLEERRRCQRHNTNTNTNTYTNANNKNKNSSNDNDTARSNGNAQREPPIGIVVVTSDFTRARETANALVQAVRDHNDGLSSEEKDDDDDYIPLYCMSNANGAGGDVFPAVATATTTTNALPNTNTNTILPITPPPTIDVRLRERWFGEWDGKSDVHYQDVWKEDAMDPYHTQHGVESVWSVVDRATALVCDWDEQIRTTAAAAIAVCGDTTDTDTTTTSSGCNSMWVICVAHGDVLQILQTAFCHATMDPSQHRSLEHLETATMRAFQ
jgi:broad specificity phosphatase PhoE